MSAGNMTTPTQFRQMCSRPLTTWRSIWRQEVMLFSLDSLMLASFTRQWLSVTTQLVNTTRMSSIRMCTSGSTVCRYSKFDLAFLENPFTVVLEEWVAGGGELHQLVEPVDSLHPTQAAQALITEQVWSSLES